MSIGILGLGGSVIGTLLAEFMNSVSWKLLLGLMLLQLIRNTLRDIFKWLEIWGFSVFSNSGVFSVFNDISYFLMFIPFKTVARSRLEYC